jgi:inosine/xanthosine triphosphatase
MEETYKSTNSKDIIIGSKNPVKIKAVTSAFETVFASEKFNYIGIDVPSGVPDQPIGDNQTLKGAYNRVKAAKKLYDKAAFYVGVEGGLDNNKDMEVYAWMYIENAEGLKGKSRTATFFLPPAVQKLVNEGLELGHADDIVFKKENSKQKGGSVGILTHGILNRQVYYEQALILALIPFINKNLYP